MPLRDKPTSVSSEQLTDYQPVSIRANLRATVQPASHESPPYKNLTLPAELTYSQSLLLSLIGFKALFSQFRCTEGAQGLNTTACNRLIRAIQVVGDKSSPSNKISKKILL